MVVIRKPLPHEHPAVPGNRVYLVPAGGHEAPAQPVAMSFFVARGARGGGRGARANVTRYVWPKHSGRQGPAEKSVTMHFIIVEESYVESSCRWLGAETAKEYAKRAIAIPFLGN